jgi:hypothetical protein
MIQDITEISDFGSLEPGTYFIDPDADPSIPSVWCTRFQPLDGLNGSERSSSATTDTSP